MNPDKDYYAVLGLMPDAEAIVVTAAYRALASIYHPDKWKGDIETATKRMADINVAYGVLGDVGKRAAYDASRSQNYSAFDSQDEERESGFDAALEQQEMDWKIAVLIYPDLVEIRRKLSDIAHRLAFTFVTTLLETKRYEDRIYIATLLERNFLERHFGVDPKILLFAKHLISLKNRDAIKKLNRFIEVMGSAVAAEKIINQVDPNYYPKPKPKIATPIEIETARNTFLANAKFPHSMVAFLTGRYLLEKLGFTVSMSKEKIIEVTRVDLAQPLSYESQDQLVIAISNGVFG